jgi:hypothetical protein
MVSSIIINKRWDPTRLKLDPSLARCVASAPSRRKQKMRRKRGGLYLRGPIPLQWLEAAHRLKGCSLWVGIILWHIAGLKKSPTFLVSNMHMARWGVDRFTKSRALRRLEGAGLITIADRGKRSPEGDSLRCRR